MVNFYPELDLVQEKVVAPATGGIPADFLVREGKISRLIGSPYLIDGISLRFPPSLLQFVSGCRYKAEQAVCNISNKLETTSSRYYQHERRVADCLSGLHSDHTERLTSGFAYVSVGAMAGAVMSRGKHIGYRFAMPLLVGSACFAYVLPNTFKNTTRLLHDMESEMFPTFAQGQDKVVDSIMKTINSVAIGGKRIQLKLSQFPAKVKESLDLYSGA